MTNVNVHRFGPRLAGRLLAFGIVFCVGNAALASGLEQPLDTPGRYQVFFGAPQTYESPAVVGQWRSIDHETRLLSGEPANYDASAIGYSGPAGVSYFTPRLTGLGMGLGLSGEAPETAEQSGFPRSAATGRNGHNWRLGGSVGTSTLRVGAAFGDHFDPACRDTGACKTNDFWDIGVAWRFGAGALSAGYTASQHRKTGILDPETLGIFSVNAGYRIAPDLDVFGGVDWIELPASDDPQGQPRNTRFMLGTNLRF